MGRSFAEVAQVVDRGIMACVRRLLAAAGLYVLVSCASDLQQAADAPSNGHRTEQLLVASANGEADEAIAAASAAFRRALRTSSRQSMRAWLMCATSAYEAMSSANDESARTAAALATRCSGEYLARAVEKRRAWRAGLQTIQGEQIILELRDPSPNLGTVFRIVLANDVSMAMYSGKRNVTPGFGVPVVLVSERCVGAPSCKLLPVSGVFRSATAWIEPAPEGVGAKIILGHHDRTQSAVAGSRSWPLAMDSSAFYVAGLQDSPIQRLAIWSFFGGSALGQRAGVYLLEDYDPEKRPLVMIHGLASSPLTWASMSNAIWADPELRTRYQIWQVVYQSNDPMLVARRRVERQLDDAWALLDPSGTAPARGCVVLVGHSMGGVVARLLSVDTGDALLNAAFTVPLSSVSGHDSDLESIDRIFRFRPYPGIRRGIYIAAPHRGSPTADAFIARVTHSIVANRTPEILALRRIVRSQPEVVQAELRAAFSRGRINGITTLRESEPVMRATHEMLPSGTMPYHTISGVQSGSEPEGDGIVPLRSTLLAGAESVLIVESGHNAHENDQAISEVIRILHDNLRSAAESGGDGCR